MGEEKIFYVYPGTSRNVSKNPFISLLLFHVVPMKGLTFILIFINRENVHRREIADFSIFYDYFYGVNI